MAHGVDSGSGAASAHEDLAAGYRFEQVRGCAVVTASGEIDLATSPALAEALAVARWSSTRVVLDLRQVTFLDSTGIGAILGAFKECRQQRGELCLVAPAGVVLRVLTVTQLTDFVPIRASVEEAASEAAWSVTC